MASIRIRALFGMFLLGALLPVDSLFCAEIALVVRDVQSGGPLAAVVELRHAEGGIAPTARFVEALLSQSPDMTLRLEATRTTVTLDQSWLALVRSPGYAPLLTILEPGASSWTVWLQPQAVSGLIEPLPDGVLRVRGVVRDGESLLSRAGVRLHLEPLGWTTTSGADGSYLFEGELPGTDFDDARFLRLVATSVEGHIVIDRSLPWVPGAIERPIDLGVGEAAMHRQQLAPQGAIQLVDAGPRLAPVGGDPDQPPLSVRVGFADANCTQSCCTGNCAHVCVFDLETYVRRGITYEWIGSWTQNSLRAGTVAYRSYGAWHALNPPTTRPYDICSSACCQVNGPNVISAGTQAARATAGLMLKRDDQVFRSEYSAENNCLLGALSCSNTDLSCGNGFNGSPSNGWPCLPDEVGLNRDCFGHGRGMSQWGTQRWSLSPHLRLWPWIVNHYYNAQGTGSGMRTAAMTRALAIVDAAPEPTVVVPGEQFEIVIEALNRAAESHQAVLIGASIRRASDAFISDPAQDLLVELEPGIALAGRSFQVPAGTPPGSYALWVSLYVDVDGDAAISGADLVQSLVQYPGALQVVAIDGAIFGDGFEG